MFMITANAGIKTNAGMLGCWDAGIRANAGMLECCQGVRGQRSADGG